MQDWIALSDSNDVQAVAAGGAVVADALLEKGALILEVELPLEGQVVLLDYRRTDGWARAISVFYDPVNGIGILHRQGGQLVRHQLAGPLPRVQGVARITLRWDAPARLWSLCHEVPDSGGPPMQAQGTNPLPVPMDDLRAICGSACKRHPSVLWFGVTRGANLPDRAPWIGLRTPIATPTGLRHAGSLQAGDQILTQGGLRVVQSLRRMDLPSRGYFTPVLLRAPYFGRQIDMLVSADQLVVLSGPEVEYLFGEEDVLAQARHLTDGRSALFDTRRAVTACISLDLGQTEVILSEGCALASMQHAPHTKPPLLPLRLLHGYEAIPLLALLGRGNGRRAA